MLEFVIERIERTIKDTSGLTSYQDFLLTPEGSLLFDATCMRLQTIGETMKQIDAITTSQLLKFYPEIPWRNIVGLRNIISHEYLSIDPEQMFDIVRNELPSLLPVIHRILADIGNGMHDNLFPSRP